MVGPLGFDISDRAVKRAGLDYWPKLDLKVYENWAHFKTQPQDETRIFYFSKFAKKSFYDERYRVGDWFVFGKETKGLGQDFLGKVPEDNILSIPIWGPIRSLNLSNAASVVMYEAARQALMNSLTPNKYNIE